MSGMVLDGVLRELALKICDDRFQDAVAAKEMTDIPCSACIKMIAPTCRKNRLCMAEAYLTGDYSPIDPRRLNMSDERPTDGPLGDVAPKLLELTEQVLFADVWERPALSKRDRSLITVATLVALNRTEQLRWHLTRAMESAAARSVRWCTPNSRAS